MKMITKQQVQETIRRAFVESSPEEFKAALHKHNPHLAADKVEADRAKADAEKKQSSRVRLLPRPALASSVGRSVFGPVFERVWPTLRQKQPSMPSKGRPILRLRLHPEAARMLEERAARAMPGRKGGVSEYLRRLVYEHLGFDSAEHPAVEGGGEAE